MNRTLKEATVYRYYYDTPEQLREHLAIFLLAYNFAKRLKTLNGLTPYEHICQQWPNIPNISYPIRPTSLWDWTVSQDRGLGLRLRSQGHRYRIIWQFQHHPGCSQICPAGDCTEDCKWDKKEAHGEVSACFQDGDDGVRSLAGKVTPPLENYRLFLRDLLNAA